MFRKQFLTVFLFLSIKCYIIRSYGQKKLYSLLLFYLPPSIVINGMDEAKEIGIYFYLALYRSASKYVLNDTDKVGLNTKWVSFCLPLL